MLRSLRRRVPRMLVFISLSEGYTEVSFAYRVEVYIFFRYGKKSSLVI